MAPTDVNTGLPIRSEADGLDEKVIVKVIDGTPGGTNQMSVDADKNAHVEMHGNDPAGVDRVVRTSEQGALTPDGVYNATTNTKPGTGGLVAHIRNAAPTEIHQTQRITSITSGTVRALDISMHDENGDAYSETNPFPVSISDNEGTEVNDYNESASDIAKDASDTHTYTALAAFKFTQWLVSASGRANFLVEIDPTNSGSFVKKFKAFTTTADGNFEMTLREPIAIATGGKIRITRTNKDNNPMGLYSTIIGHNVT